MSVNRTKKLKRKKQLKGMRQTNFNGVYSGNTVFPKYTRYTK